jgi:hypothetical protein
VNIESKYYREILNKLEALFRKESALFTLIGLQSALLISIAVYTSIAWLELLGKFDSTVRTILFVSFLIVFVLSISFFFILPLLRYFNLVGKINYKKTAGKVGKHFPFIKDELLNALQLFSTRSNFEGYSDSLTEAAFLRIYKKTSSIDFKSIVSFEKAKDLFYYFIAVTAFCLLLFYFVPGLQAASHRLINFNEEFVPPAKYIFNIQPGDAQVTKGENLTITISVSGEKLNDISLLFKNEEQTEFESQQLKPDTNGIFSYEFRSIRSSFKYYASAGGENSSIFSVEVIDRPIIKTLSVTVTPPGYSKQPRIIQKDNGNVTALKGSVAEFEIGSTKELKSAQLQFSDTSMTELKVNGVKAEGSFRIGKDVDYKIILVDQNDNTNLSPITYSVKALYDQYPSIEVISPNKNVPLANDNRLPLMLKISDDYGFTKLLLHYRLSASKYEPPQQEFTSVEIPISKDQKENDVNYVWNLSRMSLATEDVVTYYLEVFDNDNISGPKSAKTSAFMIRVPSLDELLAKADETHDAAEKDLRETLKDAEELKRTLEKIDQDLKKDQRDLTWEEKQKIDNALKRFEELQTNVEKISRDVNKMQQELQQNNLLSEETLSKYMELQELMNELTSDEMKRMMEQMREMLQNLNRQQAQDMLENLQIDEELFKKSIERTINLLKRIQIEQKVDELLKRTEQLMKSQEELQSQTSKSDLNNESQMNELAKKQQNISKEIENTGKEIEKLSEMMKSLDDMPSEQMDEVSEEFERQENDEISDAAEKSLQQKKIQQAMQNQFKLTQNMKKMNQMMRDLQESVKQQNQMQTFTDMMRLLDNILNLSKQQEELRKNSEKIDMNATMSNEDAQKQSSIQRNLDKLLQQLSDLSQKTFAVTPEMGKALGDARREMIRSIQALQNRNGTMASSSQGEAMKSLNEAATLMKSSMEAMMQGGGQGGMMSLMQQLGQMSQQQMNLNNLTQMLQQAQDGKLTQQQLAQLQRLAQEQDLIRKSLEQMNKEARETGQSKKIPADLENIMKQMQEVITDMKTERLDDQLLQKQERILSKLLDAQRSINERDYERERESFTGQNVVRQSPADLNLNSERGRDKIKDELNKAVKEGYTKDYEELIRKYYEALQKESKQN